MEDGESILPGHSAREVWIEYKGAEGGTEELRNQLVEFYLPVVRLHARMLCKRLPESVELDDLVSFGVFGLLEAIDSFELSREVKFETFCVRRIRGAILDELRKIDWVPRLVRHRHGKLERAKNELRLELGRNPTDEELQDRLGISSQEYEKLFACSNVVQVSSHTRQRFPERSGGGRDTLVVDTIIGDGVKGPSAEVESKDLRQAIVRCLSGTSKLVVELHYFEGYTMTEVGEMLLLSESRVSQIYALAMDQIRSNPSLRKLYRNGTG